MSPTLQAVRHRSVDDSEQATAVASPMLIFLTISGSMNLNSTESVFGRRLQFWYMLVIAVLLLVSSLTVSYQGSK